MSRVRHFALLSLFVAGAAVSVAACSGDGDGGGGDETPVPTPPFEAERCQIVWTTEVGSLVEVFLLDAPVASWTTSTSHSYAVAAAGFRAVWRGGYDLSTDTFASEAVVTSGTFSLSAGSTDAGALLGFSDDVAQPVWTVDTAGGPPVALTGTGAVGSFSGFWSDPWSANVVPGSGTITVVVDGTARILGSDLSYAVCYAE